MKTLIIFFAILILFAADTAPARELSPMMTEIQAAIDATRQEVADLKLQYDAAVNDQTAMEIMREIAAAKSEGRVEMMRIQLRYARQAGNDELVVQLEEVIEKMTAPPAKGTPIPRAENHQ